jgi:hypothetical protein
MTRSSDRSPDMLSTARLDAAIERLLQGEAADDDVSPVPGVVDDMRVMAGGPAPEPSPELAALLAGGAPERDVLASVTPLSTSRPSVRRRRTGPRSSRPGARGLGARVAALGITSKVALALAFTASVAAGGAAGVLPQPANDVVRRIIEVVTPFEMPDEASTRPGHGNPTAHNAAAAPGKDSGAVGASGATTTTVPPSAVTDARLTDGRFTGDQAAPDAASPISLGTEAEAPADAAAAAEPPSPAPAEHTPPPKPVGSPSTPDPPARPSESAASAPPGTNGAPGSHPAPPGPAAGGPPPGDPAASYRQPPPGDSASDTRRTPPGDPAPGYPPPGHHSGGGPPVGDPSGSGPAVATPQPSRREGGSSPGGTGGPGPGERPPAARPPAVDGSGQPPDSQHQTEGRQAPPSPGGPSAVATYAGSMSW